MYETSCDSGTASYAEKKVENDSNALLIQSWDYLLKQSIKPVILKKSESN